VGIKFVDVVLEALDPAVLLGNPLAIFFFTLVNKFCKVISQPFVLLIADVGEGRADDANDGRGEGSCM